MTNTMNTYFTRYFRPDVRGDVEALASFSPGSPFFFACNDPNEIGLIYTDNTTAPPIIQHLCAKATDEIVSVCTMSYIGLYERTLAHLIMAYHKDGHESSDKNAVTLTYAFNGGHANKHLTFYTELDDQLTVGDMERIFD